MKFPRALLCGFVLALDSSRALRDIVIVHADLFGINPMQRWMLFDRLIHQRLRHRGIVDLAVAMTTVAEQVHAYVGAKFVAVFGADWRDPDDRVDVFTVDVKDRNRLPPRH